MQESNFYKVDPRYNSSNTPMITTNDRPSVKSYRGQIETMLTRWHQLHKEKREYQKQQQHSQCQPINFDEIMETDLNRQLQELEQQEQEQYIETLKQYEQNEQQHEYNQVLQQLKQYEQLDTIRINQQKTNSTNYHIKEEHVYIHQQKQTLQSQLTIIKENQMKIRKIVHLLQSCTNKKNIFVIQKSKSTKTK